MHLRTPRRLVAVCAAALVLASCGGSSDKKPGGTPDSGLSTASPRAGGSLTINIVTESRGLDPFTASMTGVTDSSRLNAIYDTLVYADAKTGRIEPRLAESLSTPDAGRTWRLVLRDGVKFSDGTMLNADAVKFTWDRMADPATRSLYSSSLRGVTTQVVDARTVQVTLAQPNTHFDQIVAANLGYIVSPTAYQKDPQGFARKPVGAGPFLLKEWVQGDHQTYVRNPGYWQPGRPYLDEVVFRTITDQQQSFNSVQSGSADMAFTLDARNALLAKNAGFDVSELALNGPGGVLFNMAKPPFNDPRARQALALALDPEAFTKIMYNGDVVTPKGLFAVTSPLIDQAAIPGYHQDKAKAAELAKQLADEGKPLTFTLTVPQSTNSGKIGEYLQQQWGLVPGINARIDYVEINAMIGKVVVGRDYQAAYYNLATAGEPVLWNTLYSKSPNNWLNYSSPEADAALEASRAAATPEELKAAYTRLAQAAAADTLLIPLQESISYVYAKAGRFGGLELTSIGAILMDRIGRTQG
ncbi:MAG: ABC transporter substrate-binding protein [Streptomycetaceae bacterium]|nr:ABC transporter substrate-binding protein [Streptomycetaceae bacterium]